jgi:hypothetical protein
MGSDRNVGPQRFLENLQSRIGPTKSRGTRSPDKAIVVTERTFRRTLWVALLLVAPTLVFLVQAIFVVPTIFIPAGMIYMGYKLVAYGWNRETLIFIGFFLVHLAIFGGLYALLAWLVGRLCCLIFSERLRLIPMALLLAGLAALTQLPMYGGGGHGPGKFGPIQFIIAELGRGYGAGVVYAVYGAGLLIGGLPLIRAWPRGRRGKWAGNRADRDG